MDIRDISINDYTYDLPAGRIASYPLAERDASGLLVYKDNRIIDSEFRSLDTFLEKGSMLVLNNTKVVQARLVFFKPTGARIELFCLNPLSPVEDVQLALGNPSPARWHCLVGNARRWKGDTLQIRHPDGQFHLQAVMEKKHEDGYIIAFSWEPADLSFGEVLELAGKTPLPPYITREAEEGDRTTYQTVFARDAGSVAAPTAGLHFTPYVFKKLHEKNISTDFVTLHVGAGTFKPVTSDTIGEHHMHEEQFQVDCSMIRRLLEKKGKMVSVGTTSMRTLESLYWIGAQMTKGMMPPGEVVYLSQWIPYRWEGAPPSVEDALNALLRWAGEQGFDQIRGETSLIILPGYHFKMTDALVTNFHQPGSTLLLLVAAFVGPDWKNIYRHALENGYRFLSYGDACLFMKHEQDIHG